jgi:nucleoside-diphosphate-sugar epimerase
MRELGRVLLTGRTGFIGGAVAAALKRGSADFCAPLKSELDLTDAEEVLDRFGHGAFDTVLHFASRGVGSDAHDEDLVAEELSMARALLPVVREGGLFYFAGSVSEYGQPGRLTEEMDCTPINAYGRAKLETGEWLRENAPSRGISACHGRIFGAYGPGERAWRLFPAIQTALAAGEQVELSDGKQIRDFVHVQDVVNATLQLVTLPISPTCVNLGTGTGLVVRDVVERMCRALGADMALLNFGARKRSPHDMDMLVADTARLRNSIGWVPPQRLAGRAPMTDLLHDATC